MYQKPFRLKSEREILAWGNKGLVLACGKWMQEGLLHRVSKNPAERLDGNWTCFPVASAQLPCQPRLIPNSDIVLWTGPVTSTKAGCWEMTPETRVYPSEWFMSMAGSLWKASALLGCKAHLRWNHLCSRQDMSSPPTKIVMFVSRPCTRFGTAYIWATCAHGASVKMLLMAIKIDKVCLDLELVPTSFFLLNIECWIYEDSLPWEIFLGYAEWWRPNGTPDRWYRWYRDGGGEMSRWVKRAPSPVPRVLWVSWPAICRRNGS